MHEQVRDFIVERLAVMNFSVDLATVADDTPIGAGGLGLESLHVAELSVALERRFGVEISDELLERMVSMSLGDLARRVAEAAETDSVVH